jgi:hypothetical protein
VAATVNVSKEYMASTASATWAIPLQRGQLVIEHVLLRSNAATTRIALILAAVCAILVMVCMEKNAISLAIINAGRHLNVDTMLNAITLFASATQITRRVLEQIVANYATAHRNVQPTQVA